MTLPYELAKELKDAGFQSNGQAWCEELKEILPVPDLEELVEACGASIDKLQFEVGYVEAFGRAPTKKSQNFTRTRGDTALEAVARLWLALNRKT